MDVALRNTQDAGTILAMPRVTSTASASKQRPARKPRKPTAEQVRRAARVLNRARFGVRTTTAAADDTLPLFEQDRCLVAERLRASMESLAASGQPIPRSLAVNTLRAMGYMGKLTILSSVFRRSEWRKVRVNEEDAWVRR